MPWHVRAPSPYSATAQSVSKYRTKRLFNAWSKAFFGRTARPPYEIKVVLRGLVIEEEVVVVVLKSSGSYSSTLQVDLLGN